MKKIGFIALTIIMVFGSIGAAYAMWSDTVTINGPVTTGTLNLTIELEPNPCNEYYWTDDDGDGIIDPGELHAGEYPGYDGVPKDVGSCTAILTDPETDLVTGKEGHQTLSIVVNNAYPGYMVYTTFLLHNIGTVPLDVVLYQRAGKVTKPDGTVYDLLWGPGVAGMWRSVYEDLDRSGTITAGDLEVLNFRITNGLPVQIDPCNVDKREIDLHFKQPLQQESTYTFTVIISAEQWEE
jgi:predicted ribosomally synthesized peptide with SipW-like signal peptide